MHGYYEEYFTQVYIGYIFEPKCLGQYLLANDRRPVQTRTIHDAALGRAQSPL